MSTFPKREIRSFVRREGRITPSQKQALQSLLPDYSLDGKPGVNSWIQANTDKPLYMEVGFGMGDGLIQSAIDHSGINFLGIEVYRPGVGSLLIKLKKHALDNVRVIWGDAMETIREFVPARSLNRVLLFFPDPWPKKRHHKRRIVQGEFLDLLHERMKPQGIIHIATDWEAYHQWIVDVIDGHAGFHRLPDNQDPQNFNRPGSKYQQRGQRLGHGVWDIRAVVT